MNENENVRSSDFVPKAYGPGNPPRLRNPGESAEDYRIALGWDQPRPAAVMAGGLSAAEIHTLRRLIECAEELDKRPRPMCRDCADETGTCPNGGLECDMRKLFADAKALHNKLARPAAMGAGSLSAIPEAVQSVPVEIRAIAQQMRTQDNECTANPLFHVEQQRTITGIDTDYDPEIVWCVEDSMIFKGDEEFSALEDAYEESGTVPENYTRTGYVHEWEFVTAFFTRSAAEQFVVQHRHKYSGPLRMSVETEPRNKEIKLVRDFIQSLADRPTASGAVDLSMDTIPFPRDLTPELKAVLKEVAPRWNAESIYSSLIDAALPNDAPGGAA